MVRRMVCALPLLVAPLSAFAQVPVEYPVVAVSLAQACGETPAICDMPYSFDSSGIYDFWICPTYSPYSATAVRLGVTWPEDWVLLESEVCYGTVLDGGIQEPGDGITLGLPPGPWAETPAIRLRINAITAGRLSLIADPATNQFAYRDTNGIWRPFFSSDNPGEAFYIQIGPLAVCERQLAPLRCNYCEYWAGRRDSGWVTLPPSLQLPAGAVLVDTLQAWSFECYLTPECGSAYPPGEPCLDGVSSNAEWLTFATLDGRIGPLHIEMTVDTRALDPGGYSALVTAGTPCGNCGSICYPMELTVTALSVQNATWGALKATYR